MDYPFLEQQNYQMNPSTDDLILNGRLLRPGMMVLIEENTTRKDLNRVQYWNAGEHDVAFRNNQWCTIEQIDVWGEGMDAQVIFIGVYPLGIKKQRRHPAYMAWIVRIDSLPSAPDDMSLLEKWSKQ